MFNIALALVLSWDDDGQTVFLAKPVGGTADIVIASLVGMIVLVIRKADRIENQVVMNMIFVYMGGKYKFILAAQNFFCKLHADFMGLLRRDLPRLKGLDPVSYTHLDVYKRQPDDLPGGELCGQQAKVGE